MKQSSVSVNIDKMKQLIEVLKTKPVIQVGVFQTKNSRNGGDPSNADIAAVHEFGSPQHNLPPRSMLRTPIHDHAAEVMGAVHGKALSWLSKTDVKETWKLIGIAAEKIVLGAFATGGYGKWAPLKYKTLLRKLRGSLKKRKGAIAQIYTGEQGMEILIDTGQLRRAFGSRVIFR